MADGAHGNQASKSTLLLAADSVADGKRIVYFPAYEIQMDELRDYRFYAEDMVHPSPQAVDYIWERFCDFALPDSERQTLLDNVKAFRRLQHRPLARLVSFPYFAYATDLVSRMTVIFTCPG